MRNLWVVFRKEMIDSLRDRRSITAAFVYSLFGPLAIGLALSFVARRDRPIESIDLPVAGAERAPGLVGWLERHDVTIAPAPADPESAVRRGEKNLVLVIPDDYPSDFREGKPAGLSLVHDASRNPSRDAFRHVSGLLDGYGREVAAQRLIARGVSSAIATPVKTEPVDLSTPRSRASVALGMLPLFLLVAAFVGGMNVAIDVTAGERERRSLEPLLGTFVSLRSLVAGKWLASVAFSALGVAVTLLVSGYILRSVSMKSPGIRADIPAVDQLAILAVLIPLALLAAASQMLVATFSRSFKEAQTYLSLLLFVPMIPGFLLSFQSIDSAPWMAWVPVVSQQVAITDLLRGDVAAHALPWALGGALTLAVAGAFLAVTTRLLRDERIVLGN
jgi:sodium transport system permease protein